MMNPESQTDTFGVHFSSDATHGIANIINVQRPNPEVT